MTGLNYKRDILAIVRPIILALLFVAAGGEAVAQSVDEHQKRVKELEEEIEYLNGQIESTQKKHKNTLDELVFLQKKVAGRKAILDELDKQLRLQNNQIAVKNREIKGLEERLDLLESSYRHLLLTAYKHRDSRIWFMYILSSENIEQGFRRWKYLKNYSKEINKQGEEIIETKERVSREKSELVKLRNQTQAMQKSRNQEYQNLLKEESKTKAYAKRLSNNQQKYRKQLAQKRKETQRLNREIERLLAEAMKEQKKTAASKQEQEQNIKLSSEFQNNKGILPWPVKNGVVVEKFGQHNHPLFKGVKLPFNNGINISTSAGSKVYSVFNGVVKQIIAIPGYNQCVLVQHGNYFTFYCKLSTVSVKIGANISTGEEIGILSSSQNTSTLHFELWHNTTKQNPELWLRKR